MKIQVASFSSSGGAGNVGKNLTAGLRAIGVEADFFSCIGTNLRSEPLTLPLVTSAAAFDNYILKKRKWDSLISVSRDKTELFLPIDKETDALILRWGNGLLNQNLVSELGSRALVLGLDDMNYFTGACHYAGECGGFVQSCSACPAVRRPFQASVRRNLERKLKLLDQVKNLSFVAPTEWMREQFNQSLLSFLGECNVINNPIDPSFFEENNKSSKKFLANKTLRVLIIAADLSDPIKGVQKSWPSLRGMVERGDITLTLAGEASKGIEHLSPLVSVIGRLTPSEIAKVFDETDILLVPSLSEAAGLVVAEAASRGVPALARRVGGLATEIALSRGGWLYDNDRSIEPILSNLSLREISETGKRAKTRSQSFSPIAVAKNYLKTLSSLYE